MIHIAQTPNQTIMSDGDVGTIAFRQFAKAIHIVTANGNISNLLPILIAFPQQTIVYSRVECPDPLARQFAQAGFAIQFSGTTTQFAHSKE